MMRVMFQLVYPLSFLLLLIRSGFGLNSSLAGAGTEASRCIERERQALLAFKKGVVDNSGRLSGWGSEDAKKDCCKWRGVTCSNTTRHVIALNLRGNSPYRGKPLEGNMSSFLFALEQLTYLDLSWNNIEGHIPESIDSLKELKHLDLSWNGLSGPIPSQLGNLTSLEYLDLSYNDNFDSVKNLEWLSHLSSLKSLNLSFIDLSKAVDGLHVVSILPFLTHLELRYCSLQDDVVTSIPTINTSSLVVLDLDGNYLTTSIFQWLFKFSPNLVELGLYNSHLQGPIPKALGNMTSLEFLGLGYNDLEGEIPKFFGNSCRVRGLQLNGNHFSGMLPQIIRYFSSGCLHSSLERLDLSDNQITGRLPGLISNFSSLKFLYLYENNIYGVLPKSIGLLSNLEELEIHSNNFSGVITEAHFSKLSKLKALSLSSNHFSININHDWSPPFQLERMELATCMLGPEFPKWIKTQTNVSVLNISHSGISDSIPKWFWNQSSSVYKLDLSFNNFSRTLPADLSIHDLHGFTGIDMISNRLVGPLPLFPANVSSINLSNNSFSGSISFLCKITGGFLQLLDLSNNQLSGELPSCLSRWRELRILNLADNQFSGKIPNSIGSLSRLASFSLRNNSFFGEVPWSLRNCRSLEFIDLSNNRFSGMIPFWIGESLPSLTYLLLKSNNFQGGIPLQLCHLVNILLLDLSNNSLSENIPWCIPNMTALTRKETSAEDHLIATPYIKEDSYYVGTYADTTALIWKGTGYKFQNIKNLSVIDISSNKLTGPVPMQMWSLIGLVQLNLSRNQLSGSIPPNMEQMQRLESLDLSRNKLSGQLPQSMSQLDSLGKLDLSHNNFSGRLPSGAHIDTFFPDSIANNPALCGPPLTQPCPGDKIPNNKSEVHGGKGRQKDKDGFWTGFMPGLEIGAAVGFVGVLAVKLDHPWKHLVFLLFNKLKVWLKNFKDFLYFIIAFLAFLLKENAAKLRRKFTFQEPSSTSS